MSLMELEKLPPVGEMSPTLGSISTRQLATLAILAGAYGYGGDPPPDPERIKWATRFLRKAAWYQLHKHHRKQTPWDQWNSHHHPG